MKKVSKKAFGIAAISAVVTISTGYLAYRERDALIFLGASLFSESKHTKILVFRDLDGSPTKDIEVLGKRGSRKDIDDSGILVVGTADLGSLLSIIDKRSGRELQKVTIGTSEDLQEVFVRREPIESSLHSANLVGVSAAP